MSTEPQANNHDAGARSPDGPLREALEDAKVLLWFATRDGRPVDDAVLSDLVCARSKLTSEGHDPDVEGTFWTAYRKLAAAVKPASVESILSTCKHPFGDYGQDDESRLANAQRTKRNYARAALFVLFCLIIFQTYWFVVSTFSANLEQHREELDGIAGALRLRTVEVVNVLENIKGEPELGDAMPFQNLVQYEPTLARMMTDLGPRQQILTLAELDLENKIFRRQRVQSMLLSEKEVLQSWDVVPKWQFVTNFFVKQNADENGGGNKDQAICGPDPDQNQLKSIYEGKIEKEMHAICNAIGSADFERILSRSKSIIAIFSQYILPLLYGLLGSLTYIMRDLSDEILNVTFTAGSAARYSLRWPLGMLAGVTVGLFFDPTQFSGLAAITPLGLAFLAGYGVELLFTALDRMIKAFTGDASERGRTA